MTNCHVKNLNYTEKKIVVKIRLHEENKRVRTTETQAFEDADLPSRSPTVFLFADELAFVNAWVLCVVMLFSVTPSVGFTGLSGSAGINVTGLEPCFSCFVL